MHRTALRLTIITLMMINFAIMFAALNRHPAPGGRTVAGTNSPFCTDASGRGCNSWL